MASVIDICNLALAHLGDTATIASIDPPEGSAQAEHCARFYPIARDSLLEEHEWKFSVRRVALTLLTDIVDPWAYCYSIPNLMVKPIAVISPDATNDYNSPSPEYDYYGAPILPNAGAYTPQPYAMETLSDGSQVILTDMEDAVLRYTVKVTDPTKFSSLFTVTLSWLLASMLAGPVIKGDQGAAEAKRCMSMVTAFLGNAKVSDANQRKNNITHYVSWLVGR